MVFIRGLLAMMLVASTSAAPTCTTCSQLTDLIDCNLVSTTGGLSTYVFNFNRVKNSSLSWVCTRGLVDPQITCANKVLNKCDEVLTLTAKVASSVNQATLQIHDGKICGDVDSATVDATGMDNSAVCGGTGTSCDCTSGVCNVNVNLTKCSTAPLPACNQTKCDEMNDPETCTVFVCGEGEQCVPKARAQGAECRPSAGICDVAETCDGTSEVCPADEFLSGVTCRNKTVADDGTSCDVAEVCDGEQPECPSDNVVSSGVTCRSKADSCDVAETCDGSSKSCPADLRKDYGYTFKCSTTIYVCAVPPTSGAGAPGLTLGNGGQSFFGSCGIGKARSFVSLPWPECVSQCINSLCHNARALSNYAYGSCVPADGSWYCEGKNDTAVPTGCYGLPWQN